MFFNNVEERSKFLNIVISSLNDYGVKFKRSKHIEKNQDKCPRIRIFQKSLYLLEHTDVVLAKGEIVQIPKFVSECCQHILERVETEGLFRKAGSSIRQKEIRKNLESGQTIGKAHHVIDVANILKLFFRELPEPLLPTDIQEALLRSLLCPNGKIHAILTCCLLLPIVHLNTLAFFMQFLNTVALNAHMNKMTIQNLAVIFTPSLMPLNDIASIRFQNHVKVIQLLITHAEMIGYIPENITKKLKLPEKNDESNEKKKKKENRRSGMFNGLRKIVGVIASTEYSSENSTNTKTIMTPCLTKSAKKRKNSHNFAFSAKRKKEILELLPESSSLGVLPNTPLNLKQTKKNLSFNPITKNPKLHDKPERDYNTNHNKLIEFKKSLNLESLGNIENSEKVRKCHSVDTITDDSYVRIPKKEYEAIRERVSVIEARISEEFSNVKKRSSSFSSPESHPNHEISGLENVLNKFEKTIEETEHMKFMSMNQLTEKFNSELKLKRKSLDNKVFRSPSARKIGTIRRRSKENLNLVRNKSWHIGNKFEIGNSNESVQNSSSPYPKKNLRKCEKTFNNNNNNNNHKYNSKPIHMKIISPHDETIKMDFNEKRAFFETASKQFCISDRSRGTLQNHNFSNTRKLDTRINPIKVKHTTGIPKVHTHSVQMNGISMKCSNSSFKSPRKSDSNKTKPYMTSNG